MSKGIVIADDLTGANATGVLLKKNSFETCTILNQAAVGEFCSDRYDCIVIPTNSRALPAQQAYDSVIAALRSLHGQDAAFYSKRIDSTLRGNLGSETDAFLDWLGEDYIAVCVPCFPSSGRCLVGGYLLVNNVLLHKTEAAQDPKNPINTSSAKTIYLQQSKYQVGTIHLDDIGKGSDELSDIILKCKSDGVRIIIFDAVCQEDIEMIATAVMQSKIKFIAVDPGVFTATIAKRLLSRQRQQGNPKIICAIGSVNGVAREQVKELLARLPVHCVMLETAEILESNLRRESEIARVVEGIRSGLEEYDLFAVVGCGIEPSHRVAFEPYMQSRGCSAEALSEEINNAFAEIVYRIIGSQPLFRGVYSTGGDITAAVNRRLGSCGLRLLDEVVPLAGYGEIVGGPLGGLKFISKGGMVGDSMAMVTCVRYLRDRLGD